MLRVTPDQLLLRRLRLRGGHPRDRPSQSLSHKDSPWRLIGVDYDQVCPASEGYCPSLSLSCSMSPPTVRVGMLCVETTKSNTVKAGPRCVFKDAWSKRLSNPPVPGVGYCGCRNERSPLLRIRSRQRFSLLTLSVPAKDAVLRVLIPSEISLRRGFSESEMFIRRHWLQIRIRKKSERKQNVM